MPKLSVIVPVYNVGILVDKCLETLINQSIEDIEIIIINDGSTDNSFNYIERFLNNKNIKYFEQENLGLGSARNLGLNNATGEYIAFVDSDDWVDIDLYKEMITRLEQDLSDIAICGIKNEYNNFISTENRYFYKNSNKINGRMALRLLTQSTSSNYIVSPVVWNKVYRKKLLMDNNINFLNNSYWEDDVFSFLVISKATCISIVPNVFYHYYQRENSITKSITKKHIDDLISSFSFLKNAIILERNYLEKITAFKSYFDRAIQSLFRMLFNSESTLSIQKKYIIYFYDKFIEQFSIHEALEYLDARRIRKLFI